MRVTLALIAAAGAFAQTEIQVDGKSLGKTFVLEFLTGRRMTIIGQNPGGKVTLQLDREIGAPRYLDKQAITLKGGEQPLVEVNVVSLGPESCLRVTAAMDKAAGTASVTYKFHYGAGSVASPAFSTNNIINYSVLICNGAAPNAQTFVLNGTIGASSLINTQLATGAADGAQGQTFKITGAGRAGDQIELTYLLIEGL